MRILIDGSLLSSPLKHRSQGLRFRRLCQQMVWDDTVHEWFVCAPHEHAVQEDELSLAPYATMLTIPWEHVDHDLGKRDERYRHQVQQLVDEHHIDLYWHPAASTLDVPVPIGLEGTRVCLSLDETHSDTLRPFSRDMVAQRQAALITWTDSISFATSGERERFLIRHGSKQPPDTAVLTPPLCPVSASATRAGTNHPNVVRVLYAHEHPRENELEQAVRLLNEASTSNRFQRRFKLVVVGHVHGSLNRGLSGPWDTGRERKIQLETYSTIEAMNAGGPICDAMYVGPEGNCDLELLSIALTEAMPVIAPQAGFIHELVEDVGFHYNPNEPGSLEQASRIALLDGPDRAMPLRKPSSALQSTWDSAAAAHVAWFQRVARPPVEVLPRRLRIAYASPWAPQRTGVADYSASLTEKLAELVELTVFTEANVPKGAECQGRPIRPLDELPSRFDQFDAAIYHIGNNVEFHKAIYQQAWERPGVAVIHDSNIHSFMSGAFFHSDDQELFFKAVEDGYGIDREDCDPDQLDMFEYPMSRAIAARSRATIVHNRWARQHLDGIDSVYVIPHGAASNIRTCDPGLIARIRKRLSLGSHEFVVVTMGYVNRLKRVPIIVQAIAQLRSLGYPVRLVIGGSITDEQEWLLHQIAELDLHDAVTVTGYLTDDEFDGLIQLSNVVLNLRYPSMGESSGTMYKAMAREKPCIVSDYGQFAELPDDACWKISTDHLEVHELVSALAELLHDPTLARTLGTNAKSYVQRFSSYELSARLYVNVLAETVAASTAGGNIGDKRSAA